MDDNRLPELLGGLAGVILSLVAEYAPGYQALEDKYKRLAMLAALLVAAGAVYGLSCAGWLAVLLPGLSLSCDGVGLAVLVRAFIAALASNQSIFSLLFRGKNTEGKNLSPTPERS